MSEDDKAKAFEELYVAEGSDWFWWYGDDHFSGIDDEFDTLFRTHLKNVYKYIKKDYPDFLDEPVISSKEVAKYTLPSAFIDVTMDGKVSNYFEWLNAGEYDPSKDSGAATQVAERLIKKIFFGFNASNFYLRIDFNGLSEDIKKDKIDFMIEFLKPRISAVRISSTNRKSVIDGTIYLKDVKLVWDDIVEVSIPFNGLKLFEGEKAEFIIKVFKNEEFIERVPSFSTLSFEVPDLMFEWVNWRI